MRAWTKAVGPAALTPATKSSELLGHPPDARLLIINCDDFGMYPAINAAVIESVEEGIASSCSLMVPPPAASHALELLRRRPQVPFGIHLTLVSDFASMPWGPLAHRERVPSLLDSAATLFPSTPAGRGALLGQARLDEAEVEFRAQIAVVAGVGLTPTHLDFHCLADGGRDDILDLTVALAAEYGLAVRVWLEPARRSTRQQGLPVTDNDFLDSFSLGIEGKAAGYVQLLRDLPAGLNEWAVHPSLGDEEAQAVDGGWLVRRTDYEFLTSSLAREVLQQEEIHVIDYRGIQHVWSQSASLQ
ncbi:polysaccharide deacetylase family protein [Streptomyces sp. MT29]|nr:polysaccharide deacetylase family protein [Streptomyces sp. MT29]